MISRRLFLKLMAGAGVLGMSGAAYGFGVEPRLLRVTPYNLQPKKWTSGLELKIAAVADIHACDPWMDLERVAGIVERTNAIGADIIVLLGDYGSSMQRIARTIAPDQWAPVLARLKAPLGVHAIQGNHDWWHDEDALQAGQGPTQVQRALEAVGIPVYENRAVRLIKDGQPFWLAGLGDQIALDPMVAMGETRGVDDLNGTLAQITDDAPVILMAHEPDIAVRVPDRVSLLLSGHTHGGQVRLFGRPFTVPSRYGRRFAYGHMKEQCDIIVSGGIGCSILPVRFGIPPEIVLVTLGGKDDAAAS